MADSTDQQGCKITLHWLNNSRAQRIIWMLEELKLDYELKLYKRGKDMLAPAELKGVHPLGKSPVVEIQAPAAEKPIVLAESGVIIEYLAEHFGTRLVPKRYPDGKEGAVGGETEEWLRYRYLMHYGEGSLMTVMIIALVLSTIKNAPVPFFIKPITRGIADKVDESYLKGEIKTHLVFMEEYLGASPNDGEFFCGTNLSGADFMMIFALEAAFRRGPITEKTYPKLHNWVRRMQAREAYKRAGDKVAEASGEPFVPFSDLEQ